MQLASLVDAMQDVAVHANQVTGLNEGRAARIGRTLPRRRKVDDDDRVVRRFDLDSCSLVVGADDDIECSDLGHKTAQSHRRTHVVNASSPPATLPWLPRLLRAKSRDEIAAGRSYLDEAQDPDEVPLAGWDSLKAEAAPIVDTPMHTSDSG